MGIIVWLVIGGVLGWMASILTDAERQQSVAVNVMVGVAGSLLGGMLVAPLIGMGDIDNYGLGFPGVLLALGTSVLLLMLLNRMRRARVRGRRR